jgi:hypothetical protein
MRIFIWLHMYLVDIGDSNPSATRFVPEYRVTFAVNVGVEASLEASGSMAKAAEYRHQSP